MRKGIFIVIEGADGSGKTVQAKLLAEYIKSKNIPVKYYDFPQYYNSFHGKTVARFLKGEFGKIDQISPYLASLAFALDRTSVRNEMKSFLKKGGYIIANRYIQSNMAHQGAKFKSEKERKNYLEWVCELEYKIHKMPKENVVIYLRVPWQITIKLLKSRKKRAYLNDAQDIHEGNIDYQKTVEKMYLGLAQKNKNWIKIDCVENQKILAPEIINKKIIEELCSHSICI